MELKKSKFGETLVIKPLKKRLGFSSEFRDFLFDSIEKGNRNIIINCSKVEFFDTGFLGLMVRARKKGCQVGFCRVNDAIFSIFSLTDTDKVFHFFGTQKEGVEFFQKEHE